MKAVLFNQLKPWQGWVLCSSIRETNTRSFTPRSVTPAKLCELSSIGALQNSFKCWVIRQF